MRIFILANEVQQKELESINLNGIDEMILNSELPGMVEYKNYDVFFILSESWQSLDFIEFEGKPVFINAVTETLSEFILPLNVSRINAWPGFLQNKLWEVVSTNPKNIEFIFKSINRDFILVKDEPGLVTARVISMIINEAFFALGENVSTKEEIDLAMKLGTNYPLGPFEWAEKIGVKRIYQLLKKLSEKDDRYLAAPLLEKLLAEEI